MIGVVDIAGMHRPGGIGPIPARDTTQMGYPTTDNAPVRRIVAIRSASRRVAATVVIIAGRKEECTTPMHNHAGCSPKMRCGVRRRHETAQEVRFSTDRTWASRRGRNSQMSRLMRIMSLVALTMDFSRASSIGFISPNRRLSLV